MIGYIRGKVTALFKDSCFLEAGGIGYRIFISDKTRQKLTNGEEAKLLTYMAVREDAILLYGFLGEEEYSLFLLLISISKIGPKVAMGILSSMTPSAFVGAVKTQNVSRLTKLPGIGKKTAERLLVELKDKVGAFSVETISDGGSELAPSTEADPVTGEAVKALMSLGYEMDEITPVLQKLSGSYDNVSKLVSAALREFARNRE
ncbi:Holliday junction branch migration protein RuvA [uncultured Dialister sp.]|jgi:Holliday junction DNA helicase RuvA|uniref:Holliday junction branch migration protein RuvA n=1 Tax=uncultured Dialister sp. TaxID=278064 RepID=UPI0025EC0B3D|nr:Holliday junction branch migration protein RuvA [uncultured Dialister sp.]